MQLCYRLATTETSDLGLKVLWYNSDGTPKILTVQEVEELFEKWEMSWSGGVDVYTSVDTRPKYFLNYNLELNKTYMFDGTYRDISGKPVTPLPCEKGSLIDRDYYGTDVYRIKGTSVWRVLNSYEYYRGDQGVPTREFTRVNKHVKEITNGL